MQFFQELEIVMVKYRLSGEGYTDEEMRVLKHMCKDTLADINEFMRKKEEKKKKERKEKKKRKERKEGIKCKKTLKGSLPVICTLV